jgi:uncharacterized protein DUF3500
MTSPQLSQLKPRPRHADISGRQPFAWPEVLQRYVERHQAEMAEPFVGVTTDGHALPGLFPLQSTGVDCRPLVEAATAFLAALSAEQRSAACFAVDDERTWRSWSNISPFLLRHGVLLEALDEQQRDLGMELVRATLSQLGYDIARNVMRLNYHIGELTGRWQEYGEWVYWLSIFGSPSLEQPWGWQIDGHHLIVNCLMLGDQVVTTPQFMGSEPVYAESGKYAGTRVFEVEEARGFAFMRGLGAAQQERATVGMQLPFDAVATAPHDNLRLAYEGLAWGDLSATQQTGLVDLIGTYLARLRPADAEVKLAEVKRHLAQTHFAWIGACDDDSPFYYRIHSPVLLVEFDHQIGIAMDNDEPSRNHVHTLIRTPNGNDYGRDLLRQHYARHHQH